MARNRKPYLSPRESMSTKHCNDREQSPLFVEVDSPGSSSAAKGSGSVQPDMNGSNVPEQMPIPGSWQQPSDNPEGSNESASNPLKRKSKVLDDESAKETIEEDENPNEVSGYDASTEIMPQCPIYHDSFASAKKAVDHVFEVLLKCLDDSTYTDENIEALKLGLEKSRSPRHTEEVRVGLIGDMATGKSSLLNSIMGLGVLARKGDTGRSCTWVVQEFGRPLPGQNAAYRAEVVYYDKLERSDILTDMFREAFASAISLSNEVQDRETSADAGADYDNKQISQSSIQALHCLLCDQPDYGTEAQTAHQIRQAKCDSDEQMLRFVKRMADRVLGEEIKTSNLAIIEASTPGGLLTQLRRFTTNSSDIIEDGEGFRSPSHWPLIKVIRFGLTSKVLQEGVTLVDLPGLRDMNRVRAKAVSKAMRDCNHYLVIADIKRAQDDDTLFKYLYQGYEKFGSGRSIAVCTKIDEIDDDSLVNPDPAEQQNFLAHRTHRGFMDDQKTKVGAKMRSLYGKSPSEVVAIVEESHKVAKAQMEAHAADEEFRVNLRNKSVTRGLQRKYKSLTGDCQSLPVFCVSNKAYETYQVGFSQESRPLLSLNATGILALRRHLFVAVASGRFNEMIFLRDHKLPSLLASFELWCSKTHMARRQEILEYITTPKDKVEGIFQATFLHMKGVMVAKIMNHISNKQQDWNEASAELCQIWQDSFTTSQYLPICRQNGWRKATNKHPEVCWNWELTRIIRDDMKPVLEAAFKQLSDQERPLMEALGDLLEQMKTSIQSLFIMSQKSSAATNKYTEDEQASLMALDKFIKFIDMKKPIIEEHVEAGFEGLREKTRDIKRQLLTDCNDSVVSTCMTSIYVEVRSITGARCGQRRFSRMKQLLSGEGKDKLWTKVGLQMGKMLRSLLMERHNVILEQVKGDFEDILDGFNACCQDKPIEDEEETELRAKLSFRVAEAWRIVNGLLHDRIEECKTWA